VEPLAIVVRWLLTVSLVTVAGAFAGLLLVVRPAAGAAGTLGHERRDDLDRAVVRLARGALAVALLTSCLDLWRQVTVATGTGPAESLDPARVLAVMLDTRYGTVWMARMLLLVLLGGLLLLARDDDEAGWAALRAQALALGAASLALGAAAGHAAAAEPAALSVTLDALHLLGGGLWAGALVPLLLALGWTARLPDAAAIPAAAAAARGFSRLGVIAMATLVATGLYAGWRQLGGIPELVGTAYGRWLALKLALFLVVLVLAARNLLTWRPLLRGAGAEAAGAAARLRRSVRLEALVALGILLVVAVLGVTTPGRHTPVTWPLPFRFDWEVTKSLPGVRTRVAIGSQLATLGLIALLLALVARPRRWRVASLAGVMAMAIGVAVALPPMAIDANPATYLRPAIPYAAASIVEGQEVYAARCAECHGPAGYGDGPAGAGLPRRPADLTARHAGDHTAGDLFWWLTHGIPGSGMPAFGGQLSVDERWDAINFVRALGAAEAARRLGPIAERTPTLVAPDFSFTTGLGDGRALRDWRGSGIVLLVFFTLPESADRLVRLSELSLAFSLRNGVVLGVPLRDAGEVYRRLGERPVHFPIVVDGAAEAAAAYTLFRKDFTSAGSDDGAPPASHMEMLIDRQGYLRARWIPADVRAPEGGWADPARLLGEVDRLARERPSAPAAEHVH